MNRKIFISNADLKKRFWMQVDVLGDNDCWNWNGVITSNGYGRLRGEGGKNNYKIASRVSWELHFGEIPNNMQVCHRCDNRKCVNPKHLFLGTNRDNVNDKVSKNRQKRGVDMYAAKLDEEKVSKIRILRSTKKLTYKELSKMFGVAIGQICDIVNKKAWKHVLE